jgi:hypothetical protein
VRVNSIASPETPSFFAAAADSSVAVTDGAVAATDPPESSELVEPELFCAAAIPIPVSPRSCQGPSRTPGVVSWPPLVFTGFATTPDGVDTVYEAAVGGGTSFGIFGDFETDDFFTFTADDPGTDFTV